MAFLQLGNDGQSIDTEVFFDEIEKRLFRNRMTEQQRLGMLRLLRAWHKWGTGLDTALCYIMGTSYLETGARMQPVLETFADSRPQAAARLQRAFNKGQLTWVRTPYWNLIHGHHWVGGGDVQLTHEANYKGPLRDAVMVEFDLDIGTNPDLVLDPMISAFILIEGMMSRATLRGDFTGHALEEYVNETKTDYHNARKTVNPGDKPSYAKIAGYAGDFEVALAKARAASNSKFNGPESDVYNGRYDAQVEDVQRQLKRLGYHDVGTVDGKWGGRTAGAVLAYRNDNGLPLTAKIDGQLLASLMGGETRVVSDARSEATVEDLREAGSSDVERNDSISRIGKAGVVVAGAAGAVEESGVLDSITDNSDNIGTALDLLDRVKDSVAGNSLWIIAGMGGVMVYLAWRANQNRVKRHQTGEYVSR